MLLRCYTCGDVISVFKSLTTHRCVTLNERVKITKENWKVIYLNLRQKVIIIVNNNNSYLVFQCSSTLFLYMPKTNSILNVFQSYCSSVNLFNDIWYINKCLNINIGMVISNIDTKRSHASLLRLKPFWLTLTVVPSSTVR